MLTRAGLCSHVSLRHSPGLLLALGLLLSAPAQAGELQTLEVPAKIRPIGTPKGAVAACLDGDGGLHIVTVREGPSDAQSEIAYTLVDTTSGEVKLEEVVSALPYRHTAPSLVVDAQNTPHVAWFCKRDPDAGTRPGNFAVYYARRASGGGFETEQVSTNPTDPKAKGEGNYHCYVNGRPQITLRADGGVSIVYLAMSGSVNEFKKYLIEARGPGGWSHERLIEPDSKGTYAVSSGVALPLRWSAARPLAWIEISNYVPLYLQNATDAESGGGFPDYAGYTSIKHAQLDTDDEGNLHMFWHNTKKGEEKRAFFVHVALGEGAPGTPREIPCENRVSGNFRPATVDPTSGCFYGFYQVRRGKGHLVIGTDPPREVSLTGIGSVAGKRSLQVRNGRVALVTASRTSIFVTYGTP